MRQDMVLELDQCTSFLSMFLTALTADLALAEEGYVVALAEEGYVVHATDVARRCFKWVN
jgi:hypothetical protein